MNKNIILMMILIAFIFISGCVKVEEKEPIKVTLPVWGPDSPIYVAKEKGYFSEEGIEVEIIQNLPYKEINEKFRNNEVDGAFNQLSDVFSLLEEGIPSKFVLIADYTYGADAIAAKPKIEKVEDLKGKKIGIDGLYTFSHLLVLKLLEKHGLTEVDVQFENIAVLDMPKAMEEGLVDAGHVYEPAISEAKEKGFKIIADSSETPGLIVDGLFFHKKIVVERPEDIQKFINAWFKAKEFIKNNREEGMKIMADANNLPVEEFELFFEGLKVFELEDNKNSFKKSNSQESVYKSAEIISEFLLNRGQLSKIPDFDEIIEPKFVNNIK